MSDLIEIEKLAKRYADALAELSKRTQVLDARVRSAKRRSMPGIIRCTEQAVDLKVQLKRAVNGAREEFDKPRTRILHGVKVGLRSVKQRLAIADQERTLSLIKKHLADQADVLIRTEESPVKDALEQLSDADMKRIGVVVEQPYDAIVVKEIDGDVEKVIDALLKGDDEEEV